MVGSRDELIEDRASVDFQLSFDQYAKDVGEVMCLHARHLQVSYLYCSSLATRPKIHTIQQPMRNRG